MEFCVREGLTTRFKPNRTLEFLDGTFSTKSTSFNDRDMLVCVVSPSNRYFHPTTPSAHPVRVLIFYPRYLLSSSVDRKNYNNGILRVQANLPTTRI